MQITSRFIQHAFKANRHIDILQKSIRLCNTQNVDVRVRFAPSPTGFLHLGGLRTALYNYLYAKSNGGSFIIRIEDTDRTRIIDGAVDQLLSDLEWSGMIPDEGPKYGGPFGPYTQSERLQIYSKHVEILLNNGSAYRCFCTDRRLDLLRREALRSRQIPKYDNRCRHLSHTQVQEKLSKGEKSCIRFKLKTDCETFEDLVYGNISYDVALNEGDPVIVKSDHFPTYHFANVVDDHLMKITHVLRGVEWQISTTKHILMYRAFGWEPPQFGHLPLLLNADGSKLSKRQGDIKIASYRRAGIFPQALLNFVTYSGGGFNRNSGLKSYSMDELIDMFEMERLNANSVRVMPERLADFNRLELMEQVKIPEKLDILVADVKELVKNTFPDEYKNGLLELNDEHIRCILLWAKTRITQLSDLVSEDLAFLWIVPAVQDVEYDERFMSVAKSLLVALLDGKFANLHKDFIKKELKVVAIEHNFEFKELMQCLRGILSGLQHGPGVAEMMEILGKTGTVRRLENYVANGKR